MFLSVWQFSFFTDCVFFQAVSIFRSRFISFSLIWMFVLFQKHYFQMLLIFCRQPLRMEMSLTQNAAGQVQGLDRIIVWKAHKSNEKQTRAVCRNDNQQDRKQYKKMVIWKENRNWCSLKCHRPCWIHLSWWSSFWLQLCWMTAHCKYSPIMCYEDDTAPGSRVYV